MVDVVDNCYGSFSRSEIISVPYSSVRQRGFPYALPFFEFTRSDISRSRARLGSKF